MLSFQFELGCLSLQILHFSQTFLLGFSATDTTAACSRSYWSRILTLSESEAIVCIFNETDTNTLIQEILKRNVSLHLFLIWIFHFFCIVASDTTAACSRDYWSRILIWTESEATFRMLKNIDTNTLQEILKRNVSLQFDY